MSLCSESHSPAKLLKAHIAFASSESAASALADALGSPQRRFDEAPFFDEDDEVDMGEEFADVDVDDETLAAGDQECFNLLKQLKAREKFDVEECPVDVPDSHACRNSKAPSQLGQKADIPDQEALFECVDIEVDEDLKPDKPDGTDVDDVAAKIMQTLRNIRKLERLALASPRPSLSTRFFASVQCGQKLWMMFYPSCGSW